MANNKKKAVRLSAWFSKGEGYAIKQCIKRSGASQREFIRQAVLNFVDQLDRELAKKEEEIHEKNRQEDERHSQQDTGSAGNASGLCASEGHSESDDS